MKLTVIILLTACLAASAKGVSQTVTLSEKNVPLEKVFKAITQQTGYEFLYNIQMLQEARKVSIDVRGASLEQVLAICFTNQPITYTIKDKIIVLMKKQVSPKEQNPNETFLTTIDVSGKVTDASGLPLAGASIKVKGTTNGTTTDASGVFVLKGVDENATLIFSYAEHETVELKVSGRTSITAALKRSEAELKEVIIKKGYYDEKQRFTLGNSVHIDAKQIEKAPVQNPLLAIQGLAPGIEITQLTGMNGGGVKVRIQGQNSIASGLDPLIVIDGIPYGTQYSNSANNLFNTFQEEVVQGGSPLNFVNPNDIESIDILKDADATAIYGSRAANGAILITTKKGRIGGTKLTVNLQQGWGKVTQRMNMMNKDQYLQMRREAISNDGLIPSSIPGATSPFVYAPDLMFWDTTRYTDWRKELIGGTAKYTNINASVSGGTSVVQYKVGATYKRQTTVFPSDFDDRSGNVHLNLSSATTNQRLKLQISAIYSYDQNNLPGLDLTRQAFLMPPNAPALYNADGSLNWAQNSAGNSTWINPVGLLQNNEYNNNTKNLIANVNLSYRIFPGLEIRSNFGYTNTQNRIYNPTRLESERPERRPTFQRNAEFGSRDQSTWIIEPQIQYTGKLGKGRVEGQLGATVQKSIIDVLSVRGLGYSTDLLMKTLSAATSINVLISNSVTTRFSGLFGRLNYIWDDKYLINLTARRDGSNKFGEENKFHNFGSVALGWIFSQERFLQQNIPFLSFGKFRASYGSTGNDQITDFGYLSTYGISNPTVLYQNSIGLNVNKIPNPYLQWEVTRKWQFGLDLGFIKDRILIGATYVRNRSSNQLISYSLPAISGFANISKNIPALIQNTSLEFTLNTVNVNTSDFKWNSNINVTIPRNKLLSFPGIESTVYSSGTLGVIVGQPLGVQKTFHFAGTNPSNGAYSLIDQYGNPTSSPTIAVANGNVLISPVTKWYGGFNNSFSYRKFQLDFLFQFVQRIGTRDLFYNNGSLYPGEFGSYADGSQNQPVNVLNRWQKPGDDTQIGRYSSNGTLLGYFGFIQRTDDWYTNEASYIRLKNVSLSWQLPQSWVRKLKLQNSRLYANAQNLLTFTKYSGLDPETMSIATLPPLRMITVGVQAEF